MRGFFFFSSLALARSLFAPCLFFALLSLSLLRTSSLSLYLRPLARALGSKEEVEEKDGKRDELDLVFSPSRFTDEREPGLLALTLARPPAYLEKGSAQQHSGDDFPRGAQASPLGQAGDDGSVNALRRQRRQRQKMPLGSRQAIFAPRSP